MAAFTVTLFPQKRFQKLLARAWFVVRCFSFVKQAVLVIFLDDSFVTTKSLQYSFSYPWIWLPLNTSS